MSAAWIGVDLDGTLAEYASWKGMDHIGPAVPAMLCRVRNWLVDGRTVKIFTARVSDPAFDVAIVHAWLANYDLPPLEVTATKDFNMLELWDDRCVQVEPNTGRRMDGKGKKV